MMEHTGRFKSHSVNPSTSVSSSQEEAGLKVGVVVRFRLLISLFIYFFINKVFVFACVGLGGQSFGWMWVSNGMDQLYTFGEVERVRESGSP